MSLDHVLDGQLLCGLLQQLTVSLSIIEYGFKLKFTLESCIQCLQPLRICM